MNFGTGGAAVSAPNTGDLWWNGTALYFKPTGTAVNLLAAAGGMSIGGTISNSPVAGSVLYVGNSGVLAQDSTAFNYDYTDHTLGLGTSGTSTSRLTIQGTTANNTAYMLYATNSDASAAFLVRNDGHISVNDVPNDNIGIYNNQSFTATAQNLIGLNNYVHFTPSANNAGNYSAISGFSSDTELNGTHTQYALRAIGAQGWVNGSGALTYLDNILSEIYLAPVAPVPYIKPVA